MKQCHPAQIGGYRLTGILGHGGMGTVYRARIAETGRIVALKLLDPAEPLREALGLAKLREIFATEAAIMSGLSHPNIAEVLDSGRDEQDRPFYVMEHFCANLGMLIGEHYLVEESCRLVPAARAIAYGCQILDALQFLHSAGVIHRDIKPFNMLLSEADSVKICDFGMARRLPEKSISARGMHIGSPYYTAPEQLGNPEDADGRADLYAVGVLLYRMLTGELPAMKGFMLSQVNPLYDAAWDAFFARALSWRPDLRFQSAAEMTAVLRRLELYPERAWGGRRPQSGATTRSLRSSPLRVSGDKAREVFAVDHLWQPLAPSCGRFTIRDADTMLDEATGLVWQNYPAKQPVDLATAAELVGALNEMRFAGIDGWRLPTVNELLSLCRNPPLVAGVRDGSPFPEDGDWFWSCDRRSAATSWYANTCLCFAGWQNNDCRFAVRAVASASR
jgi:serine/threonine-protein kinase